MKQFGISLLSTIPMRKEPSEQSEMVSQILFGESFTVLSKHNTFYEVLCQYDNYQGWIDCGMVHEISESFFISQMQAHEPVQKSVLMSLKGKYNTTPIITLAGSTLPGFDQSAGTIAIDQQQFTIEHIFGAFNKAGRSNIADTAKVFLNTPYLWGGRSVFGCDCSGFMQVVFKIHHIKLQRDASQQAQQGEAVASLSETQMGDIAFFNAGNQKIKHVGMILSPNEIIHNSGCVHIDKLDETGIYSSLEKKYTHYLHSIRRMIL